MNHSFFRQAVQMVPRVLGFVDRDPRSSTFGCCDRTYWHYRLTDVANARYQEAGLLLAWACSTAGQDNPFHHQPQVRQWVRGIWRYWLCMRGRDGFVSEVYPHERSFCATAFSAAAFLQTVILMGGAEPWREELLAARSTLKWLARHSQTDTANQMAASYLALSIFAMLTGDADALRSARKRRDEVLAMADADGVFEEYGGMDTGYQSITLSMLTRTQDLCGEDPKVSAAIRLAEKALVGRLGSCGAVDVAANSRRTQFLYPYALARSKNSRLTDLEKSLSQGRLLNPSWMDDRYCIGMAIDYGFAAEALAE